MVRKFDETYVNLDTGLFESQDWVRTLGHVAKKLVTVLVPL